MPVAHANPKPDVRQVIEPLKAFSKGNTLAAYLDIAIRRGLPLATFDDALKGAAQNVGVPLYAAST